MKNSFPSLFAAALLLGLHVVNAQPVPSGSAANPAIDPQPRNTWIDMHEGMVKRAKLEKAIDLVFIGDSITAGWNSKDEPLWNSYYKPINAYNFGIGGDRTENVLWRLKNGALAGLHPKAAMIMIGTNNISRGDTSAQIAEGVTAVVQEVRMLVPETKILLLGIFPSGEKADNPRRKTIAEINEIISKLHDGKNIFYEDIGKVFLQPDGSIAKDVMSDALHPTNKGRDIWHNAVKDKLAELMK